MSQNSSAGSLPTPLQFSNKSFNEFDVEIAERGEDIIYHFWPKKDAADFPNGFARNLEDAFKSILPETADVRAAFTSKEEAKVLSKFGDIDSPPVPSYYVCVIGWANNPLSEKFLKNTVLTRLDSYLAAGLHA
tara:strand:- start:565 stop:963 length:399 start_codon:yes stop_codon:yes gene_type:complete